VEEEQGIYREEVTLLMTMLAEIREKVDAILRYIEGEDDEEEEEEEDLPDS
jgi:hypothetical protein